MALTVTAVPATDATGSVLITVTGGTGPYTVDAYPVGRPAYRVRSRWSTVPGGQATVDGSVPLNTPTQYVATDALGATAGSAVVTVAASVPILSDALEPMVARPVTVVSQPPDTWEARSRWWDVLGRRDPFMSAAPLRLRAGDVVLYVPTTVERAALMSMLRTGNPLLLRSVCPDAVDDVTMAVDRVRGDLVNTQDPNGPRLLTLTYQAVSADLGPYGTDAGRTYATVKTEQATYALTTLAWRDYRGLLLGYEK